jgi:hypothetical protein
MIEARSKGGHVVRKVLTQLLVAVGCWVLLIAGCILYSFLHASSVAYIAGALLFLWYLYIPLLWIVVFINWPIMQKLSELLRARTPRL